MRDDQTQTPDARPNGPPSAQACPPGTEVGRQLKVAAWEPGRLRLIGDGGDRVFLLIGLACVLVGLASAAILIRNGTFGGVLTETWNDARWPVQFARWLTLLGVAILLIVLRSTAGGFHYTFDGPSRTVSRDNFLRVLNRAWPADRFDRVELDFTPAGQFDQFSLWLVRKEGGQRTCLTYTNADRPETVPMVVVARAIGELLALPVQVIGESRTASAELRAALPVV